MSKILTKLKNTVLFLFCTHIGRILFLFLFAAINFLISDYTGNDYVYLGTYYAFVASIIALFGYFLVFIAYAWVINPIREYKQNKAFQKELAEKEKLKNNA